MPLKGTSTWRLHTKPYKLRDLILGEAFGIFIVFHFPDPGLFVLTGVHFYFSWRDSENTEYRRFF